VESIESRVLKTRILTSLVMAALVLAALFGLEPTAFAWCAAVIFLGLGQWEASRLAGLKSVPARLTSMLALLMVGAALTQQMPEYPITARLAPGCVLWLVLLPWLARPSLGLSNTAPWIATKLLALAGVLLSAWLAMVWLQERSPWLVVLLIVIMAATDIGAYFSGRHFGGARLAPAISPGKTWAGVFGGLLATLLLTPLAVVLLPAPSFSVFTAALLALLLGAVSIGGDLTLSLLKRQQGLKDSSRLIPGHGGLLDRLDSLGAALPFFALAVVWLGR